MSDTRINDIEAKLAHLEMQFEDLNSIILDQAEMITYLKAKLSQAESKIEEIEHDRDDKAGLSTIEIAARDKPPHY